MVQKETATPIQKADETARYYSPEVGESIKATNQTEAQEKFEQMTGEKVPKKLTNKPATK